jgi:putative Holliday junction resolvase
MPRILAVDYGTRRVGLALSDPTGTLATGLPTYQRRPGETLPDAVARLAREHGAAEIVLGHPLNMDGSRGPRALEVERFAGDLRTRVDVPVTLRDERLSTARAYRVLRETGVKGRAGRERVDRLAAVLVLQGVLDERAARRTPAGPVVGTPPFAAETGASEPDGAEPDGT